MTTTYQHFSLTNTELWLPHTNISALQTQSYDYHIPTFLPYKYRAMTTRYQHFCLTNTELWLPYQHLSLTELWLPHTNISPLQTQSCDYHIPTFLLQTQSYDYHIPTFLSYKHRAMTTTYQHVSLTNTELWLPHTNISALQTQSYDYHILLQTALTKGEMRYVVVIALCL